MMKLATPTTPAPAPVAVAAKPATPAAPAIKPTKPWNPGQVAAPLAVITKPTKGKKTPQAAKPEPVKAAEPVVAPAPVVPEAISPEQRDIIANSTVQLGTHQLGLKLVRTIIRSPDWSMKIKGAKIITKQADSPDGEGMVVGKTTAPSFRYNVHALFNTLTENERQIRALVDMYTVTDAEDGLRLISIHKEAQFLCAVADLIKQRKAIAAEMDAKWYSEIVPVIKAAFGQDFSQMEGRLVTPPFGPLTEVVVVLRKSDLTNPEDIDWSSMEPESRKAAYDMTQGFIKKFAQERAQCIIAGVLEPVVDMALEINGEKPNPAFKPDQPEGPENRRMLPPALETGKRRASGVDEMLVVLERVLNFGQFVPDEIKDQITAAKVEVEKCKGRISVLNGDRTVQRAIRTAFVKLGDMVRQTIEVSKSGRAARDIE